MGDRLATRYEGRETPPRMVLDEIYEDLLKARDERSRPTAMGGQASASD